MGDQLNNVNEPDVSIMPPWLDSATASLAGDIVRTLAARRADMLAVILYGSIARHDERSPDDTHPSDVDLLAIFDTDDEHIALRDGKTLFSILGEAYNRHLDILRDVKVMFASRNLSEWDTTFVASVNRDGVLLWARGELPDILSPVAHRGYGATDRPVTDKRTHAD
ncbi:MAG TPA: nucleotidyltransferase domain-containing protein [Ktedonobacterales bacterium]|jgi:predicted nucleotidyltransferase